MKNSIIKLSLITLLFTLFCTGSVLGQTDHIDPLKEIFKDKYPNVGLTAKREIADFSRFMYQHKTKLFDSERNALRKVTNCLLEDEELPKVDFNYGDLLAKTALRISVVAGEIFYDKSVKDVPVLGTSLQFGKAIYKEFQENENLKKEFNRIKNKKDFLSMLDKMGDAIEEKNKNFWEEDIIDTIMAEYNSLSTISEKELYIRDLKKYHKKLKSNMPLEQEIELASYQALIQEIFFLKNKKMGYIDVYIDYSHYDPIQSWKSAELKMNNGPFNVHILLKLGPFSKNIENKLNELVANSTKYTSVLELKGIPQIVTCNFIYNGYEMSTTSTLHFRGKTYSKWNKKKKIKFTPNMRRDNTLWKKFKDSETQIHRARKNEYGVRYTSIVLAPYKYVYNQKNSTYKLFRKYTSREF